MGQEDGGAREERWREDDFEQMRKEGEKEEEGEVKNYRSLISST
jgi:hypothetical protein